MALPANIPDLPDKLAQREAWEQENDKRSREGAKELLSWAEYTPLFVAVPFFNWMIDNLPGRSADGRSESDFHATANPKAEFSASDPSQFEILDDGNLWYYTRRGERLFDIALNLTDSFKKGLDNLPDTNTEPGGKVVGNIYLAQSPEFQTALPWNVKLWWDTELPANVPLKLPKVLAVLAVKKYRLPIVDAPNGGFRWETIDKQVAALTKGQKRKLLSVLSTVAYIPAANTIEPEGQPPPGPMMSDAQALEIVRQAWKSVTGNEPKKGEALIVCAIGRFEGMYGAAFGGINNWGAIQTSDPAQGVLISEYNPFKNPPDIKVYVRKYATPLDGAIGLVKELVRRDGVKPALAKGDSEAVARAMYESGYYTTRTTDKEKAIGQYRSAIDGNLAKIAANTGEKLEPPNEPGPVTTGLGLLLVIPVFAIPVILAKRQKAGIW